MNQVPIRLGPLALLLTIISICLTTLSILTYTTSGADLRLAEKYADTVRVRYELEAQGQAFLQEAEDAASLGLPLDLVDGAFPVPGGGVRKTFEKDGTVLTVQLAAADKDPAQTADAAAATGRDAPLAAGRTGNVRIVEWKIVRQWEEDGSIGNIWMPE